MHSFFQLFKDESKAEPKVLPRVNESDLIIAHMLDKGSFGQVYFGSMKGEPVAIKKILNKPHDEKEAEINLHGTLYHPNIVRALARYNNPMNHDVCLILEYMDGKDLLHYLIDPEQKKILSLQMRIGIMQNIIDALTYLHQTMHILHRDIKPENILLNHHMQAKLCDFGLSTTIEKAKNLRPCGSLDYSAPELLKGKNRYHTEKTDVYAMGATVFAIITITNPLEKHKTDIVKAMMANVDSVPLKTANVFKRMVDNSMVSNPHHRMSLADMSKLTQAIGRLSEHPIEIQNKTTQFIPLPPEETEVPNQLETEASYNYRCTIS